MFKTHRPGIYTYNRVAFSTNKGIFTLSATDRNWIDTFKNLKTGEFHEWPRQLVYKWWKEEKIIPVEEATAIDWYENQRV